MHREKNLYLIETLKKLKLHGYKCYSHSKGDWCYAITPDDNVLYIQPEYFGGYSFTLEYEPGRRHGMGCQCFEKSVDLINLKTIKQAEIEGLNFARKLNAPMYKNSEQWYKGYWEVSCLEEI